MRSTLTVGVLAIVAAPVHLVIALFAPGGQVVAPAHVLLRLWNDPSEPVGALAVLAVELASAVLALAALLVGALTLPFVLLVALGSWAFARATDRRALR